MINKKLDRKVDTIFEDSKIRITTETKENSKIFRIEVKYFNQVLHANITAKTALAISDAIYDALPENILDELAKEQQAEEKI